MMIIFSSLYFVGLLCVSMNLYENCLLIFIFLFAIFLLLDHFTIQNGEWNILNMTVMQEDIKFPCCPEPYSTMSKEFVLKRRALYYFLYILLPLISLAFLFMMVFFIPHDSGERMGFGVTILLSITVYLLVISEALPEKSDDKSMLGICFITEFYLLCGALVLSLITVNLHRKTTKPPDMILKIRDKYQYYFKDLCKMARNYKNSRNTDGIILRQVTTPVEPDDYLQYSENMSDEVRFRRTLLKKGNKGEEGSHENGLGIQTTVEDNVEDVENANNKEWQEIAAFLDWVFFIITMFFLGFVPVVVTMSLDRSGLWTVRTIQRLGDEFFHINLLKYQSVFYEVLCEVSTHNKIDSYKQQMWWLLGANLEGNSPIVKISSPKLDYLELSIAKIYSKTYLFIWMYNTCWL